MFRMDIKRKITKAIIATAIDKGIRDMEENSNRGIRRLVDLGNYFVTEDFQKNFFTKVQQMLDDSDNKYYKLVNHIIQSIDHQVIKHFGINLGYNSLTYGAKKIQEYQKKYGFMLPWTMVFDFRSNTDNLLSDKEVSEVISNIESLGIYCSMLFINDNIEYLKTILAKLESHKDSCFFIFVSPNIIDGEIAATILDSKNIAVSLYMDAQKENNVFKNAVNILLKNKCLYGAYSICNDNQINSIANVEYMETIQNLGCAFTFFIRENLNDIQNIECFTKFMNSIKHPTKGYPIFIVDFYEGLSYLNKKISSESCFIAIKGNGAIAVNVMSNEIAELNVRTHSIESIIANTMPRV